MPWSTPTPVARVEEARRVIAGPGPTPARLDPHHAHRLVVEEREEEADRVRSPADARHEHVREPAFLLQHLGPRLAADHRLEVAHHHRIGVRAQHGAEEVVGVCERS